MKEGVGLFFKEVPEKFLLCTEKQFGLVIFQQKRNCICRGKAAPQLISCLVNENRNYTTR